jgi:hypothetical protein
VGDADARAELEDTLARCFADDTFAWELDADKNWTRRDGRTRDAQRELVERALGRAVQEDPVPEVERDGGVPSAR